MNYQEIYSRIIERAKYRQINGYVERHHIIPRCMRGSDCPENIVKLTPEEHYLAHQLLVKIHPGHIGIALALKAMSIGHKGKRNNKQYGWVRRLTTEACSRRMRENNPNADGHHSRNFQAAYREKYGRGYPGPTMSPEGLERIRAGKLGNKNPMYGIKPWEHPRSSEYTRSIWLQANTLHKLWMSNGEPSYGKLYNLHRGECYTKSKGGVISPYMSIVKYFRNGWIPDKDPYFVAFFYSTHK